MLNFKECLLAGAVLALAAIGISLVIWGITNMASLAVSR
jgi:branched-subunit amino acid ABC-type transport system permease component